MRVRLSMTGVILNIEDRDALSILGGLGPFCRFVYFSCETFVDGSHLDPSQNKSRSLTHIIRASQRGVKHGRE